MGRVPDRAVPHAGQEALDRHGLVKLAPAALVVTWSSGFVGAELASRAGVRPWTVLGWRFAVLALLLVVVCALLRVRLNSWAAWRRQALIGGLSQPVYLVLVFEGVHRGVSGGTTALIAALQPLLVATVAGRLLGERSSALMWVGMLLGLAGVAIVVSGDLGATEADPWVFALPTVGMLSLAAGTVLTRRLRPPESLLQTITMQAVVTFVVIMTGALAVGQAAPPRELDAWLAIAWLVALASLGGYALYVFVTRTSGATAVSTLLYLTPPTTMGWVFLFFGVPITATAVIGLIVSGLGVLLVSRRRARDAAARKAAAPTSLA